MRQMTGVTPMIGNDSDGVNVPIGVQIITAPWHEDVALRIGYDLDARGIARAPQPPE